MYFNLINNSDYFMYQQIWYLKILHCIHFSHLYVVYEPQN